MATRTTITITDDLDGSSDGTVRTVRFSVNGSEYEIDLNEQHREEFERALAPYASSARAVTGRAHGKRGTGRPTADNPDNKAVRAWARANGIAVSDRGRISTDIKEQYLKANA